MVGSTRNRDTMIPVFKTKELDSRLVRRIKQGHPNTLILKRNFANCNSWCSHRPKRLQISKSDNERASMLLSKMIQGRKELRSIPRYILKIRKKITTMRKSSIGNPHLKEIKKEIQKLRKGNKKDG
jgi:hypothetical protein